MGINSLALKIGPAINWGKYTINSKKLKKLTFSLNIFFLVSNIKAIAVNVINEIASGRSELYESLIKLSWFNTLNIKKEYLKYNNGKKINEIENHKVIFFL